MRVVDLLGIRFGRLVVLERAANNSQGQARWRCACDCGGEIVTNRASLQRGRTKSCGCLSRETTGDRSRTHGMRASREYESWAAMLARCTNPRNPNWPSYGGRGISVCDRWRSFDEFLADMGPRPEGMTLDRFPDTNGNYEPTNCRWATRSMQNSNRRPFMRAMTKASVAEAVSLIRSGQTRKAVAAHFGVKSETLSRCIDVCGYGETKARKRTAA